MLTAQGNTVLPKKPVGKPEDYEWLRKTGLDYLQQFSGQLWTDFNTHDPGVTIHELLCYAITDLAYRSSFPVADLLTAPGAQGPDKADFFTARKILTSHPVTTNDYKKLVLDRMPGIRNLWLDTMDETVYSPVIYFDKTSTTTTLTIPPAPHQYFPLKLKGLYNVRLEAENFETIKAQHPHILDTLMQYQDPADIVVNPDDLAKKDRYKTCLANYTKKLLLDSRNLCEDFINISVANEEWVAVCADIELKPDANADNVFLEIMSVLQNYVNPVLQFYNFKEMLDKGKRTDEIFNGPAALRGFIDETELAAHGRKEVLYVSDIISLLMDIPGVLQVKKIHLSSYKEKPDGKYELLEDAQNYCLHLTDPLNAAFSFKNDAAELNKDEIFNHIRFSKGAIYFAPKRSASYSNHAFVKYPSLPKDFENDLPVPKGKNRNLNAYYSVQNDFPLCYYTGMEGIPGSETTLRKAQRLQAKAYLLFFDQVMADYLAFLDNLRTIFSWRKSAATPTQVPLALNETIIRDLRRLLAVAPGTDNGLADEDYFKSTYTQLQEIAEPPALQKRRRNRLLDHLLARFNEAFADYAVFKFQQNTDGDFFDDSSETLNDKISFLRMYPVMSSQRSHAINYTQGNNYQNISGLQLRVQKMTGLSYTRNKNLVTVKNNPDYKALLNKILSGAAPQPGDKIEVKDNRFASFDSHFGLHVLEHILLRPLYKKPTTHLSSLLPLCGDGSNNQHADCLQPDLYSMQLTVVVPGWLAICQSMQFRSFTETMIRTEAPAHVALKICWLDPAQMFLFEKCHEEWMKWKNKISKPVYTPTSNDILSYNKALNDMYRMMGILKNMYPASKMDNCEDINYNSTTGEINTPVILNHTALGAGKEEEWFVFETSNEEVSPRSPIARLTAPETVKTAVTKPAGKEEKKPESKTPEKKAKPAKKKNAPTPKAVKTAKKNKPAAGKPKPKKK